MELQNNPCLVSKCPLVFENFCLIISKNQSRPILEKGASLILERLLNTMPHPDYYANRLTDDLPASHLSSVYLIFSDFAV